MIPGPDDVDASTRHSSRHSTHRNPLRTTLHRLLGGWPEPDRNSENRQTGSLDAPLARLLSRVEQDGMLIERLAITPGRQTQASRHLGMDTGDIPAILTRPVSDSVSDSVGGVDSHAYSHAISDSDTSSLSLSGVDLTGRRFPLVLYCHAHGGNYALGKEELIAPRKSLPEGPYAAELAARGIAALCIDLPCFGERQSLSESSLAKALLWHGDTLFGVMLRELAAALDYLETRDDIDMQRVATLGLSMGSTLGWWLAALDDRVSSVAELCCLADLAVMVDEGAHDGHGIYMMVPGLLAATSTLDIAELIVPRPHLCTLGGQDALTPPTAVRSLCDSLSDAYAAAGAADAWQLILSPETGHVETPAMRQGVLDFLCRHLQV